MKEEVTGDLCFGNMISFCEDSNQVFQSTINANRPNPGLKFNPLFRFMHIISGRLFISVFKYSCEVCFEFYVHPELYASPLLNNRPQINIQYTATIDVSISFTKLTTTVFQSDMQSHQLLQI